MWHWFEASSIDSKKQVSQKRQSQTSGCLIHLVLALQTVSNSCVIHLSCDGMKVDRREACFVIKLGALFGEMKRA